MHQAIPAVLIPAPAGNTVARHDSGGAVRQLRMAVVKTAKQILWKR